MISVGVDIVEVDRFQKATEPHRVASFFLTPNELELVSQSADKYQYLASRFAVKEAVIKAIPEQDVGYLDFEILKDGLKPMVKFTTSRFDTYQVAISLSHTEIYAVGFATVTY